MAKVGLRGINALPTAAEPTAPAAPPPAVSGTATESIRYVPWTSVAPNPLNRRKDFGDLNGLAESISEVGQIQACSVVTRKAFLAIYPRYEPKIGAADYVMVVGARRRAAIELAELPDIKIDLDDSLAESRARFYAACITENDERKDFEPLEEALAIQDLVEECGSGKAAASALKKSPGFISQRLALLKLSEPMQELLRNGDLPIEPARRIASKYEPDDQLEAWRQEQRRAARDVLAATGAAPASQGEAAENEGPERPARPIRVSFPRSASPREVGEVLQKVLDAEAIEALIAYLQANVRR